MGRKSIIVVLSILLISIMSACTRQTMQDSDRSAEAVKVQDKKLVFRGTKLDLPDEASTNYRLKKTEDGLVLIQLGRTQRPPQVFLLGNDNWREITPEYLLGGQEWGTIEGFEETGKSVWILYREMLDKNKWRQTVVEYDKEEGIYRKSGFELPDGREMGDIGVLSDGSILLFDSSNFTCYRYRKGKAQYSNSFYAGGRNGWQDLGGGRVAVRMTPSKGYTAVQASTGEVLEEVVPPELFAGDVMAFSRLLLGEQADYAAGCNGIYERKPGEDWRLLASSDSLVLYDPDTVLQDFLPDGEGGFYILLYDGLWHYTPEWVRSKDSKTLQILSLYQDNEIKKQVIRFRTTHPDTQVNYETFLSKETAGAEEEAAAVEKLTAQLMAGKKPDVLVLDHLPWQSYAKKGLLLDLQPVMEEVLSDEDFLNHVISGYRQPDGKLYAAVAGFTPIFLTLRDGVPENVNTLNGLDAFLEEEETRTGFLPEIYHDHQKKNLGQCLYQMYGMELFDEEGKWRPEKGKKYLRIWKTIEERMESGDTESSKYYEVGGWLDLMQSKNGAFVFGFGDSPGFLTPEKTGGYRIVCSEKYKAGLKIGIWADSGNPEQAGEFLRQLFFSQKEEREAYSTVCKSAAASTKKLVSDRCLDKCGDTYAEVWPDGLTVYYNKPEDIPKIIKWYEQFRIPVKEKDALFQTIWKNFFPCLQGKQELDAGVKAVEEAVHLYQQEQE